MNPGADEGADGPLVWDDRLDSGVPVVVTYHPAYLLRTPADKAKAWEDLCLAAGVAEAGDVP